MGENFLNFGARRGEPLGGRFWSCYVLLMLPERKNLYILILLFPKHTVFPYHNVKKIASTLRNTLRYFERRSETTKAPTHNSQMLSLHEIENNSTEKMCQGGAHVTSLKISGVQHIIQSSSDT